MSFSTKYRPDKLDAVLGNSSIKKVISEMATSGQFSHILLEGTRGCGKTTLAMIIADLFGADSSNIDKINCVHNSGVDEMRSKLDWLGKTSFFGKKKVLILDEIHGLSKQAQQVFLTPLEELGVDILIIACTTTVESVNPMLLDRFKRLKVLPLNDSDSISLLKQISIKEDIKLLKWKMSILIEKCGGIPRLLLSGLEKVKSIDDEKEVSFLLDLNELSEENPEVLELFKFIISKADWNVVKVKLKNLLKELGPEAIRIGLANILGARLLSDYGDLKEKVSLAEIFDKHLKTPLPFPDRANLITTLFLVWKGLVK